MAIKLKLVEILEFYDTPQVIIVEDSSKLKYICVQTDTREDGTLEYMGVSMTDEKLHRYLKGKNDLRSMFIDEDEKYGIWSVLSDGENIEAESSVINNDNLPESGFYNRSELIEGEDVDVAVNSIAKCVGHMILETMKNEEMI